MEVEWTPWGLAPCAAMVGKHASRQGYEGTTHEGGLHFRSLIGCIRRTGLTYALTRLSCPSALTAATPNT